MSNLINKKTPLTQPARLITLLFLVCFGLVVIRNAWLSDDAYITLRTVDNFVHGYGLVWNVGQRVQSYTHPLWMFLLSAGYGFTREAFFTTTLLCIAVSMLAAAVVAGRIARAPGAAVLALTIFACSKSFVDYATSGLENPLTHLLLALFLWMYTHRDVVTPRRLGMLGLLAALGIVNRTDTALLFLPPLAWALLETRSWRGMFTAALGFTPLIAWELFSIAYYGFPFPNTAYAKLNAGLIARADLVRHGACYLLESLRVDPLTLTIIAIAVALTLASRTWRKLPIVTGIALYLAYIVWIGADFMSGRFLTAPLFVAVTLLVSAPWSRARPWLLTAALVGVLAFGLFAPGSPLVRGGQLSAAVDVGSWLTSRGIADERANYYPNTGLLIALQRPGLPDHDWVRDGQAARARGPAVVALGSVGFYGYFAGPEVTIIDLLGLGDPLMARLPPTDPQWRIGHFGRSVPTGYVETLERGETLIHDARLAAYYTRLDTLIRGPLWTPERWAAIWRFNTGGYDAYLEAYAWARGGPLVQDLVITNPGVHPYVYAYVWNNGAAETFLLDDASSRGATYPIRWSIAPGAVHFEGAFVQHTSALGTLSDAETLNVGVYFADSPALDNYDIYERRFWFRQERDGALTIVLPGGEWRNPDAPGGAWRQEPIGVVVGQE